MYVYGPPIGKFYAYDNAGGTNFINLPVNVPLDTEVIKTSEFTHSTVVNPAEITINDTGVYHIIFDVSFEMVVQNFVGGTCQGELWRDTGGGFARVTGWSCYNFNYNLTNPYGSAGRSGILNLNSSDKIKVTISMATGSNTHALVAQGSGVSIMRIA